MGRERRPLPTPSMIERMIEEAIAAGEFDDLPGRGKPIRGLEKPYDELWWVKDKLEREGLSTLPVTLELKREVELRLARLDRLRDESTVRAELEAINRRIREVNRAVVRGPMSDLMPLDVDQALEGWRQRRAG